LLGLFLDPEVGGDMFLRNVGRLSKDYAALYLTATFHYRVLQSTPPIYLSHMNPDLAFFSFKIDLNIILVSTFVS
jgi:hypothetical protein